ncbi:hypothetical protein BBBOND_0208640 [Babesia bigemina]|uniref:Uncharacterized protein n=1 Tax=Babesia bigemina TaxID=5866 RepID=A0A061DCQ3_BABBI|nr:hypothetical protein BBBOND_0208640 [Babesia bigemina]CDR95710.1 hypothetical protein BBBOND_0208640 [Babesia bigemina]|eukprot:XP_012767896.1 hypothetical protein BBBOND_0208640 [Babesia bigemina]
MRRGTNAKSTTARGHLGIDSEDIVGGNRGKYVDCKICRTIRVAGISPLPDFMSHLFSRSIITKAFKECVQAWDWGR